MQRLPEETITTVVKTPRVKRRISPARPPSSHSPSRSSRSEFSTPEPVYMTKFRQPLHRHDFEAMQKASIPTLFVTEAEGASVRGGVSVETIVEEQTPKWVEVEEIIEFNVKKSAQTSRKRGASPVRAEKDESSFIWSGSRPRRSPEDDPNTNNSNNKLVEEGKPSLAPDVEISGAEDKGISTSDENISSYYRSEQERTSCPHEPVGMTDSPAASPVVSFVDELAETTEPGEDPHGDIEFHDTASDFETTWAAEEGPLSPMQDKDLPEAENIIIEEPEGVVSVDLSNRDLKILTRNGKALTLEDLEDYVPEEGETYRCGNPNYEDKPCEIAVLQTEINKPTVGKPVLLNVGRPVVPKTKQTFFSKFEGHHPSGVFMSASMQSSGPSNISFHVSETHTGAVTTPTPRTTAAGTSAEPPFKMAPSFCTKVQLSADNGQSSFKTEVSTRTLSYGSVGEPVTLCIKKEDPSQS
uniref:Uncharacterized protein n=1 Tax=Sphaerodactylus townsendi TaxID=933632 RepID=A0ACB8FW21_9SAUR